MESLFQRSNGIPLHVEELLAAATDGQQPAEFAVPDTLREAVLSRSAMLSLDAAEVAGAASVVGRSFDLAILVAVAGRPVVEVAGGVEELVERAFVESAPDGWYDFRHVLIREALQSAVPLARRRELHARVAAVAVDRPDLGGAAFRSEHEEAAGNDQAAHTLALEAAIQAVSLSNHREALALYRRAVRRAPVNLPPEQLAALLIRRGVAASATDDNADAVQDFTRAYQMLIDIAQPLAAVEVLPSLVAARHLLGDGLTARTALLEQGLAVLAAAEAPAEQAEAVRGRLNAALAEATCSIFGSSSRSSTGKVLWPRLGPLVMR